MPVSHTLVVKNFFLISNLHLLSFSLKPLPFVLSLHALVKSPSPAFLQAQFKYWMVVVRSPHRLLFSRLNSPNSLSLSSQQRCSSPRIIFVASSGPAPTAPCPSCTEGSRAGCRTPGGVWPEWSRGAESPPLPCCIPRVRFVLRIPWGAVPWSFSKCRELTCVFWGSGSLCSHSSLFSFFTLNCRTSDL